MSFLMQNGEVLYRGKVRKMDVLVDDLGRVTAADQIGRASCRERV